MLFCILQNLNEGDPPLPCVYVEKIVFELDKNYNETMLQVLVSPAVLVIADNFKVRTTTQVHVVFPKTTPGI